MPRDASVSLDHVYGAIADPTRRAILTLLSRGDITVGALAHKFPISLNGVSKHVKVLERAGLVDRRVEGREHWLTLNPAPLGNATRWLERHRAFWESRLTTLEHILVDEDRPARKRVRRK
jgi:DNA-binding transcriptional ArsR family regulator